jgi:hypothetical protein
MLWEKAKSQQCEKGRKRKKAINLMFPLVKRRRGLPRWGRKKEVKKFLFES